MFEPNLPSGPWSGRLVANTLLGMTQQLDPTSARDEVKELREEVKRLTGWVTAGKVAVPVLLGFLGYTNIFAIPREVDGQLKGGVLDEYKRRAEEAAVAAESALKKVQESSSQATATVQEASANALKVAQQHADDAGTAAANIESLLADLENRRPIQHGDEISLRRKELLLVVDNKDPGRTDIRTGWREQHDSNGRTKFTIQRE